MSEETKEKILHAAISLFAKKGYENTSVNDIVSEAGVTKPVLYYYFNSKDGLYQELFRHCMDGFEKHFRATFDGVTDLKKFIYKFVRFDLEMMVEFREIIAVLFAEFYSLRRHLSEENLKSLMNTHHNLMIEVFSRCFEPGKVAEVDMEAIIRIMESMLSCYEMELLRFNKDLLSDELVNRLGAIMYKMVKAVC